MQLSARFLVAITLATLGMVACSSAAPKPAYPEKVVTVVVPFAAGGGVDQTARALAEAGKPYLSQPLSITNRPGGGGSVGFVEMLQSKPDGYTISVASSGVVTTQPHLTDLPYKTPDDYRSVIKLVSIPYVFLVRDDAPWTTMKDLVEYAKANPGKIRVGSAGVGSIPHVIIEMMKSNVKVDLTHVPFSGGGESVPAVLGGHVEGVVALPPEVIAQVRAGKAKVLTSFTEKRNPFFPDVPSSRELGYDVILGTYHFAVAPKGTPDPAVQTLHDAFKKAIESESFRKFAEQQFDIIDYKNGADLKQELEREYRFYADVVVKLSLKKG